MNPNITSRLRGIIYRLKREWGDAVDVYTRTTNETNAETGERNINAIRTSLDWVIVPPAKITRPMLEGIFMSNANQRLVRGVGYDSNERTFIIDRRDTPDLVIVKDDWIGYEGIRYDIEEIEAFPTEADPSIYIIQAKGIVGEPIPGVVHSDSATVQLTATITAGQTP